jgi:hypothetical protein
MFLLQLNAGDSAIDSFLGRPLRERAKIARKALAREIDLNQPDRAPLAVPAKRVRGR